MVLVLAPIPTDHYRCAGMMKETQDAPPKNADFGSKWDRHLHELNDLLAEPWCLVSNPQGAHSEDPSDDEAYSDYEAGDENGSDWCRSLLWPNLTSIYTKQWHMSESSFPVASLQTKQFEMMATSLRTTDEPEACACCLTATDERRLHSIDIVLHHVLLALNSDDLVLTTNMVIRSSAISADGVADFVVFQQNRRQLVVIAAENDDLYRGAIKLHLLMDVALAQNEDDGFPTDFIYGAVTNYRCWYLFKRCLDGIVWFYDVMPTNPNHPDVDQVPRRLCAMSST